MLSDPLVDWVIVALNVPAHETSSGLKPLASDNNSIEMRKLD